MSQDTRPVVLLVDDDADLRASVEDTFIHFLPEAWLVTAASATDGLEVLRKEIVALIVADYRLPGKDGLQFLIEARALAPGARSMMLTGFPTPELALRARTLAQVSMVVAKPVDAQTLIGTIDFLLGRTSKMQPTAPGRR